MNNHYIQRDTWIWVELIIVILKKTGKKKLEARKIIYINLHTHGGTKTSCRYSPAIILIQRSKPFSLPVPSPILRKKKKIRKSKIRGRECLFSHAQLELRNKRRK